MNNIVPTNSPNAAPTFLSVLDDHIQRFVQTMQTLREGMNPAAAPNSFQERYTILSDDEEEDNGSSPQRVLSANLVRGRYTLHSEESDGENGDETPSQGAPVARVVRPFSPWELDRLIREYNANNHPTRERRSMLAATTGNSLERINTWFHNRRQRDRLARLQPNYHRVADNVVPPTSHRFSLEARARMETLFEQNRYPSRAQTEQLASELGVPSKMVRNWFPNRRRLQRQAEPISGTRNI